MPRFAANLSMLYPQWEFLDRFAAAAADGFQGVEFLFPYAFAPEQLASALQANGLQQVLFNTPAAGTDRTSMQQAWAQGARGTACLPGHEAEFLAGVRCAIDYAKALHCPRVHVMAGLVPQGCDAAAVDATYLGNLRRAADLADAAALELTIEPINTRDMPGYYLHHQEQAHAILAALDAPHVKVQMDLYHCQIMEGDLAMRLRRYLPTGRVGHIQIAGVPDRQEPDVGEIHYPYLFGLLDELGYTGWVGCEYHPTPVGLGWLHAARSGSGR